MFRSRLSQVSFSELAVVAIMMFPIAALDGWVLSVMWGWFMVPVFSLPQLGVVPAMGISLVVGSLTHQRSSSKDEESLAKMLGMGLLMPLWLLFIGYIIHLFM